MNLFSAEWEIESFAFCEEVHRFKNLEDFIFTIENDKAVIAIKRTINEEFTKKDLLRRCVIISQVPTGSQQVRHNYDGAVATYFILVYQADREFAKKIKCIINEMPDNLILSKQLVQMLQ